MVLVHLDDEVPVAHPCSASRARLGQRWLRPRPRRCRASLLRTRRESIALSTALPLRVTWRTSPLCSTVKPVSLAMKVATSLSLFSSTLLVFSGSRGTVRSPDHRLLRSRRRSRRRRSGGGPRRRRARHGRRVNRHTRIDPRDAFRRGRTRVSPDPARPSGVHAPPLFRTLLASVEKWTSDSLPRTSTSSTRAASVLFTSAPYLRPRSGARAGYPPRTCGSCWRRGGDDGAEIGGKDQPLRSE